MRERYSGIHGYFNEQKLSRVREVAPEVGDGPNGIELTFCDDKGECNCLQIWPHIKVNGQPSLGIAIYPAPTEAGKEGE